MPLPVAGAIAAVGHFFTDGLVGTAAVDAVASHTVGIAAGTFGAGAMTFAACDAKASLARPNTATACAAVADSAPSLKAMRLWWSTEHPRLSQPLRIARVFCHFSETTCAPFARRTRLRIRLPTTVAQDTIW